MLLEPSLHLWRLFYGLDVGGSVELLLHGMQGALH